MEPNCVDPAVPHLWSYPADDSSRPLTSVRRCCWVRRRHRSAQKPGSAPAAASPADQARVALEVLNDPAKRAAFGATLDAIIKAQPAGAVRCAAGGTA